MFYLKMVLMGLWIIICCIVVLFRAIFRWREPSLGAAFGKMFADTAQKISGVTVEGLETEHFKENQPCIYVANHQSNFDIVIFGSLYPENTVVIGKKELLWIPFFGLIYYATGNIIINRKKTEKAKNIFSQVVEEIKSRKVSVWVFPEGTRNRHGAGLLPFKKGPFHLAVNAQVPIVPVIASPLPAVADFSKRKIYGGKIRVKVLPSIPTAGLTEADVNNLLEITRERMLAAQAELVSEPPAADRLSA